AQITYRPIRCGPSPPHIPYTTLFRSLAKLRTDRIDAAFSKALTTPRPGSDKPLSPRTVHHYRRVLIKALGQAVTWERLTKNPARSEEHTSELQSRENIVCRLLLEKKK